jgi:hypothetical protein
MSNFVLPYGLVDDAPSGQGKAMSFDGTDDYVDITGGESLNFGTDDFSVEWWAKYPFSQSNAYAGIICDKSWNSGAHGSNWWGVAQNNFSVNSIRYYEESIGDGSYDINVVIDSNITNGWHHFLLVRDTINNKLQFYRDGVIVYNNDYFIDVNLINHGLYFVRNSNGYTGGLIDEIHIYNITLTASQVQSQYYAGLEKLLSKGLINEQEYQEKLVLK